MNRARNDRWLAGVLGGLAEYWGCSSLVLRVLFLLFGHALGLGIVVYLILWAIIPSEPVE